MLVYGVMFIVAWGIGDDLLLVHGVRVRVHGVRVRFHGVLGDDLPLVHG